MSSNFTVNRLCEQCGNVFKAKTTVTRFCSKLCNKRFYKAKERGQKMASMDQVVKKVLEGNVSEQVNADYRIKASVDAFIAAKGMPIAPDNDAPEEAELDATSWVPEIEMLDLGEKDVTTVIYATGYGYYFNYLKFPIFTTDHRLRERTGPKDVKGLHFLNIPNQFKLKSGIILGISEDAKNLADRLEASL